MNATQLNKEAVAKYLKQYNIEKVVLEYNGSGDDGQIESTTALNGNDEVEIPDINDIENHYDVWCSVEGNMTKSRRGSLTDLIEQLAFSVLCRTYGGWEINDGSYGQITINQDGSGVIEHNEIIQDTDYSESSF